jgi:hypothetical protein
MNAPPRRNDAAGQAGRREGTGQSRKRDHSSASRPYTVVIVTGEKRGRWGSFADIETAAAIASRLRKHGMDARVVHDEGER